MSFNHLHYQTPKITATSKVIKSSSMKNKGFKLTLYIQKIITGDVSILHPCQFDKLVHVELGERVPESRQEKYTTCV